MRTRRSRLLSVGAAIALSLAAIGSATAADVVVNHPVDGLAEVVVSNCPWEVELAVGQVCTDTDIASGYYSVGPGAPVSKEPLRIFIVSTTFRYLGNDEGEILSIRFGEAEASAGYVDKVHMLSAATQGTVPMYSGDPAVITGDPMTVDLQWDLTGAPVQTSGNHGPAGGFSGGLHGLDGCTVVNSLSHQTWRWADDGISGTVDGVNVADMFVGPSSVFIEGRSQFTFVLNQTGVAC